MRTIKEAAMAYSKFEGTERYDSDKLDAFVEGAEFTQRFIPIEEDKPEEEFGFYKPVLVLVEKYGLCCSAAYKNGRFIPDNSVIDSDEITHWRPIEFK